ANSRAEAGSSQGAVIVTVWASIVPAVPATTLLGAAARARPASTEAGRPERPASDATARWVLSPQAARKVATKAVTSASIAAAPSGAEAHRDRGEHRLARALVGAAAADRVAQPVEIDVGGAPPRLVAHGTFQRLGEADDRDHAIGLGHDADRGELLDEIAHRHPCRRL